MRLYTILEKMISKLGIDWIIESSTIDGWTVEKWHSGKMVQTRYIRNDKIGWYDIPYMAGMAVSHKDYTFPVPFINTPVVLASATGGTGIGLGTTTHIINNSKVKIHVSGSQSCKPDGAYDISIIAIGKWK